MFPSPLSVFKRTLSRLGSRLPTTVQSFDDLVPSDRGSRDGVHLPERFEGVVVEQPADSIFYRTERSLFGQSAEPNIIKGKPRYLTAGIATSPRRRLYSLHDSCVAGEDGFVYCPAQRCAIEESIRQWTKSARDHPLFCAPRFPQAKHLPGLTLSLLTTAGTGFYHFLWEALPRLDLAQDWLQQVDHILVNGSPGTFHAAWLAQAGVPPDKIRYVEPLTHLRCDQLLFSNSLSHDSQPTPWLVAAIRRVLKLDEEYPAKQGHRNLWISRQDAPSRHLAWEQQLLDQLPGYERIELSHLPPADQIALFASARAIAGPHGAGLSNVLFAPAGANLIELLPHGQHRPLFGRVAAATNCIYHWAGVDFTRSPEDSGAALASAIRATSK
jgi:capsular polysaccharide biosynthesis protein